jgi:HAD superfamily hydrolase (TIGR01509 family)
MGLPRPAAVVVDLDGTLVDTVGTRIRAWMAVFAEFGLPADEAHVASLIGSDGRWLAEQVAGRAGRDLAPADAERIDHRAGEIYQALNTDPTPLPGVGDFLAALDTAGIPWAIATSSRAAQVTTSIAALGLDSMPRVVDGQSVNRAKPAPDLLLAAAALLGADPARCWCVGDSVWDVQAAAAAGMTALGVTTGAATADALADAGAALVVATIDRLIAQLRPPAPRTA